MGRLKLHTEQNLQTALFELYEYADDMIMTREIRLLSGSLTKHERATDYEQLQLFIIIIIIYSP